jgi:dCTP deaminase
VPVKPAAYNVPNSKCDLKGRLVEKPWDNWIPGVLNKSQMLALSREGILTVSDEAIGEASIDLTLTDEAYRMLQGSVKPGGDDRYSVILKNAKLSEKLEVPPDGIFTLEREKTYVFKLKERLDSEFADIGIFGQATAKSSVGRVDVLARLIVDGMDQYERFDAGALKSRSGDMYLEITPFTFRVKVKVGKSLSQLRLFYSDPREVELSSKEIFHTVFKGSATGDGSLSVDLENTRIGGIGVAAFCAEKDNSDEPICLWKAETLADPCKNWKFQRSGSDNRLKIENNRFYILRSKEQIRVPSGIAIYCRASDETIGEMRIHYAGFVHPHFGVRDDGESGTPLIFEVRGHQVDVSLRHGERMANLTLYRMSQEADQDQSPYGKQTLKLSSFFSDWPSRLKEVGNDGTVEAADKTSEG